MLYINRIYKNSAFETIRIDKMTFTATAPSNAHPKTEITARTFKRALQTEKVYISSDRVVAEIIVEGNFNSVETGSGDYTYADWTKPTAHADMSDLPGIGDTV